VLTLKHKGFNQIGLSKSRKLYGRYWKIIEKCKIEEKEKVERRKK